MLAGPWMRRRVRKMTVLEDEADLSVRPKRLIVEDRSSFADFQKLAGANQFVFVMTDVGVDRLVAHAMHRGTGSRQ